MKIKIWKIIYLKKIYSIKVYLCIYIYVLNYQSFSGGPASVQEAVDLLSSAKNPVIVSGGGVVMADGVDQVKALAEALKVDIKVINWKIEKLIISQINEILTHNNYS